MRAVLIALITSIVLVLWLVTLIDPQRVGACSTVALRYGRDARAVDCQPLGWQAFVVPIVVIGLLIPGWKSIPTPWGPLERKQKAEQAAETLTARTPEDRQRIRDELNRTARGEGRPND
jgi:hypothetical protein